MLHNKVPDPVIAGEPLCAIHYNSQERASRARTLIERSYQIADRPPVRPRPLVHRIIEGSAKAN
ncbi:MAG: hypothetical protein LAN63_07850 [Acidobacteriia bacterium]|nr:hypothetical protein [Terriglobia bacterium]